MVGLFGVQDHHAVAAQRLDASTFRCKTGAIPRRRLVRDLRSLQSQALLPLAPLHAFVSSGHD